MVWKNKGKIQNCINSLKTSEGTYVDKDNEILSTAKDFYTKLYKNRSASKLAINAFFDSTVPEKQLNEEFMEKSEGEFTISECQSAINKMKKNKSPGLDGISVEFYQKFWPLIGNLMLDVFNDSYKNDLLPVSQ